MESTPLRTSASSAVNSRLPPRFSIGLIAVAAAGFVAPAWQRSLWNPDEPRVAHIGQSMALEGGDWLVPRVNGAPNVQEPPLYHWLTAACFRVFGTRPGLDWVPRLPAILFSVATLALVARETARWGGGRAGVLAALVLATTVEYLEIANRAGVDGALAFFVLWGGGSSLRIAAEPAPSTVHFLALGAAAAFAFLTKNLLGPAFLALMMGAALLGRRDLLRSPGLWVKLAAGAAGFLALTGPWIVLLWRRDPELARSLMEHTFGRFMADGMKNPGRLEFCGRVLADGLPWTPLLLVALWTAGMRFWHPAPSEIADERRLLRALIAWILLPALFIFASGSRRNLYLLSIWPGAAILLGLQLDRWLDRPAMHRAAAAATVLVSAPLPLAAAVGGFWVQPMPHFVFVSLAVQLFYLHLWLRRRGWRSAEDSLLTAAVLLGLAMAAGNLMRLTALDARESYATLGEDLRLLGREGFEVAGFDLDLRELGAVAYHLETRSIRHLRDAGDAAELLNAAGPPIALVVRGRSLPEDGPAPLREPSGRIARIIGGREIVVLLNRPVPAGVPAVNTGPSLEPPRGQDRPR